jgi:transcriptional regulator with XRE-family HTH domain
MSRAVKELRTALGITQQALASQLGTALTTVARYEASERIPRARALGKLALIAKRNGQTELAAFFKHALDVEFREVSRKGYELVISAPQRQALGLRDLRTAELAKMKELLFEMWRTSATFTSGAPDPAATVAAGEELRRHIRELAGLLLTEGAQALDRTSEK